MSRIKLLEAPSDEMKLMLSRVSDGNPAVAREAGHQVAKALETPLRGGVLAGEILSGIYSAEKFDVNVPTEYPLDFLSPGTEKDFVAYVVPNHGYLPERYVQGDYVRVPVYDVANAISWNLKYSRDARWDVVARAMEVFEAGFVKKANDDGFHTILSAGVDRNILVYDADASIGQFTKRLVSLMKVLMRRNGGGNSTSVNRGKLTDVYFSPEAMEDILNWNIDQIDDMTRNKIFNSAEGSFDNIFGVRLHALDELGEGQEYQTYYTATLGGTLASTDVELLIGLDLSKNDSFVMPVVETVQVFDDDSLHRRRRHGIYGWASHGFAILDNRRVILASL
jgi:hypothetical protein